LPHRRSLAFPVFFLEQTDLFVQLIQLAILLLDQLAESRHRIGIGVRLRPEASSPNDQHCQDQDQPKRRPGSG